MKDIIIGGDPRTLEDFDVDWISNLQNPLFLWTEDQVRHEIATKPFFILRSPERTTGLLVYQLIDKKIAEVLILAVHPKGRNCGRGTLLLGALIKKLRQDGFEEIWLEVHEDNGHAIELYLGAGFLQVGLRPNYYGAGQNALNLRLGL